MARKATTAGDETLKSLIKIARILECFSSTRRTQSLAEICAATDYPRSTTHRLVASLREVGFLDQDRQRDRYRLGLKLFQLGNVVLGNMDLHREARPFVESLNRISGQSVHLAVFDGQQAVVVNRTEPIMEGGTPLTLIEAAPAHCTSVGKAILAFQSVPVIEMVIAAGLKAYTENTITNAKKLRAELATICKRGYAIDDGEHQPGLRCVGAPIRDSTGRVFAGISVSGPSWRIPTAEVENLSKIVIHHANQISAVL
ncbi:MAG: IclR family transcriptional regulator [Proteobacteria bacterium]|nr:IclR family transcriptional regulator [Pseudomonadota bacterium]